MSLRHGSSINPTVDTGSSSSGGAGVRADAAYRVEGSAAGLEFELYTRYTFEDDKMSASTSSASVYAAYDYSGRQLADDETSASYARKATYHEP